MPKSCATSASRMVSASLAIALTLAVTAPSRTSFAETNQMPKNKLKNVPSEKNSSGATNAPQPTFAQCQAKCSALGTTMSQRRMCVNKCMSGN